MAGSREPVFTNDEKVLAISLHYPLPPPSTDDIQNYMLAEIIKSVSPSPTTMLNLVMQLGAHQPKWDDMALPPGTFESTLKKIDQDAFSHFFPGRSVNACRAAFEDLKRSSGYSPLSQTTAPQTPLSAPIGPLRRPWQLETATSYASAPPPGRQLLPKTKSEGQAGVMVMSQSSATPGGQTKRKRGRPTKAEAQAKAAESTAAAAAGTLVRRESAITPRVTNPGPSTAPSPALGPASAPATIASPSVEPQPKLPLPPTNRVPISAMITTPTTQKTSSHSGSSSGKRRRRKSMRSEQDEARDSQSEPIPMGPAQQQQQHPQHQQYPYPHYESPYSRIEPDDTPARATGIRHYEDPLPGIPIGARLPPTPLPGSHSGSHPGSHSSNHPSSHPGSHPGYGPGPAHGDSHSHQSSRPPSR